jgi:hypothetical protein
MVEEQVSLKITPDGFIEVEITDEMMRRAKAKSSEMGQLRNSIRQGKGNLVGFLGEEITLAVLPDSTSQNTYEHDIMMDGVSFEVKSKDRTVNPRIDYEASVANFNTRQRADYYVFCSIFRDKNTNQYTHGHVIGIIPKEDYKKQATFLRVGDVDPSNGWKVSADCYNLPYSKLIQLGS